MEDTLWAGLTDQHVKIPMGITAENLADKYQITREECDKYAHQTQQRWKAGQSSYISYRSMVLLPCMCTFTTQWKTVSLLMGS